MSNSDNQILIVDDDHDQRELIKKFLKDYGNCEFAEDGLQALDLFEAKIQEKKPFDLICLDISMPIMDGHTTLKEIRRIEQSQEIETSVKVVMITAITSIKTVMSLFGDLCDAYVPKPISRTKLIKAIASLS